MQVVLREPAFLGNERMKDTFQCQPRGWKAVDSRRREGADIEGEGPWSVGFPRSCALGHSVGWVIPGLRHNHCTAYMPASLSKLMAGTLLRCSGAQLWNKVRSPRWVLHG